MQEKYINIQSLKVSESLSKFVNEELLIDTGISSEKFWIGFEKTVNELEPKNRELINLEKLCKKKLMIGILKIKEMKLN
jgi:malate synthase